MNGPEETASAEVPMISKEEEQHEPELGPQKQWALCLSGGGYRAMLFHLGALWRLNEAGFLPKLDRISSVSGGSITSARLALTWGELGFNSAAVAQRFEEMVVRPIRELAGKTIDVRSIIVGIFTPGTIGDKVAGSYRRHLYGEKTLQDLPDRPRFVINATSVQTGALWRFSKPYMGEWRVGRVPNPTLQVATAVAASSAFPPVLSPIRLKLDPSSFTLRDGANLDDEALRREVFLSDGGVYDNLGLETAWKGHANVLVSDGGGQLAPEAGPSTDWPRHSKRVLSLIDHQVRNLRKRQVISSYKKDKGGAYWGIRTNIADYQLPDPLPAPHAKTLQLAMTPTRLAELPSRTQEQLINWGYAVCDAALRKHVDETLPKGNFPYPSLGVG